MIYESGMLIWRCHYGKLGWLPNQSFKLDSYKKQDHLSGNLEMSGNFTAVGELLGNWPAVGEMQVNCRIGEFSPGGRGCFIILHSSHLGLCQCLVASCMRVYYAVRYDVGTCSFGRSVVKNCRNMSQDLAVCLQRLCLGVVRPVWWWWCYWYCNV